MLCAVIPCIHPGCSRHAHPTCARRGWWSLDIERMAALCREHNSSAPADAAPSASPMLSMEAMMGEGKRRGRPKGSKNRADGEQPSASASATAPKDGNKPRRRAERKLDTRCVADVLAAAVGARFGIDKLKPI